MPKAPDKTIHFDFIQNKTGDLSKNARQSSALDRFAKMLDKNHFPHRPGFQVDNSQDNQCLVAKGYFTPPTPCMEWRLGEFQARSNTIVVTVQVFSFNWQAV